MRLKAVIVFNFLKNLFRQYLAELDPHLIKGMDVPDNSLSENFVFIQSDQLAEHVRVLWP